nr:MAG TPA: hypothetical protein [Caudoviricetes sp.]
MQMRYLTEIIGQSSNTVKKKPMLGETVLLS